ncbi:alpha-amylase family glycosyl hydrolase [Pacificibacter marinus]|uniref:Oligo-1,6-glucosidase n=1 Tax=Pacificibacter marinus TaxID=658057 RepID=A0A1Y5SZU8_9RHOB|nr:alpha-amylase family glycosyl hydrolase [Pacificibacter marinus]SEK83955.1 alpha-glucosidase [Pacificibacter marinus]SLN48859.1 Oligo-1,6-glucosidase [Pacificibacter marinus]
MNAQTSETFSRSADWWRGAVIYQIYPRSYQDSSGDGIGDLAGIVKRLPYIASLGVDAIWISPFFTSPMKDFGYDVSDYCDVDPMFGALSDFDAVIETAHKYNVKVMIDLVLSHTSDQHPWFTESRASKDNDKSNWYVWSDAKPDGTPPNNWLSIFGGSAWQWDAGRMQYFLHNFLTSQPDLNFHEPQVQDALLDVGRFWLERGVDGFRLDTINFYTHDAQLRDNPALPAEARSSKTAPAVNPYNWQQHIYDKSRPENLTFLRKLRAVMQPYNAAAVGEVGDEQLGLEILGQYTAGDDMMHMCYAFELLSGDKPTAEYIKEVMDKVDDVASDGWACWAYSNHDVVRHTTRWQLDDTAQRLFTTLMMCLKGSACIYQGEELGLPESDVAFEDLQDPYGIEFWPEFKGRDGCRTPMVWDDSNQNGGFTSGSKPWLPVSTDHLALTVAKSETNPNSIIHHYRKAIALRHAHSALKTGASSAMQVVDGCLVFTRTNDQEEIYCAFNLTDNTVTLDAPVGDWQPIDQTLSSVSSVDGKLNLGPWTPCILHRKVS